MSDGDDKTTMPGGFEAVLIWIGAGLLAIGLLETIGPMSERPHRAPVGAFVWFVAGVAALALGWAIGKARS